MSECEKLRGMALEADSAEDAQLQEHAASCSLCREQLLIDGDLRRMFQGIARPAPSPHFNPSLRERLLAERERQRHRRWRLLLMQAYWLAAGVASAIVLISIHWPSEMPSVPVICSLGAVFGIVLLTPLVLLLTLRIGPTKLILNTIHALAP